MDPAVKIAFITCAFNFAAIMFSRWLSHLEHKSTERKVNIIMNGKGKE